MNKILKIEVSQDSIKDCFTDTKIKLGSDIMALLQVREKNQDMFNDWIMFIISTPKYANLRPGEIYQAFQMAMSRELKDSKGNDFNLLPELSNNTTAAVIESYLTYKRQNDAYQKCKQELIALSQPKLEPTDEQKESIRLRHASDVFTEAHEGKTHEYAFSLYPELEATIMLSNALKKRLYSLKLREYRREFRRANPESERNAVKNRCMSLVVCNFVRKRCADFETFKRYLKINTST